ncbi:MAG: serine hydrolase [Tissierellaceae bacterium]|nr:serine hydrolase [Tissierellaceae bacterium]
MKKRVLSLILVITLVLGISLSAIGAAHPIEVTLNDTELELENQVFINEEGKVMVPVREIAEVLGYEVSWDGLNKSVVLSKESNSIKFNIENTNVVSNGKDLNITTKSVIKNDKTFVPLELLSKGLNLVIGWDNKYQALNINEQLLNNEEFFKIIDDNDIKNKLDTYLRALEKNQKFFGSVLVAKNGEILINEGYGFSDVSQQTENKSQTEFAIGSVTKQFVSAAIMQLSEKGLIGVDDKISKYLPDFPKGDLITIHNLLTHSSGLVDFTSLTEVLMNVTEINDENDILEFVKDKELSFKPGEGFEYCNTNYLLLGLIVEEITNMNYEEYLKTNIFEPLNMNSTGFNYEDGLHDATAYTGYLDVAPIDDELILGIAFGAGNMYSTVEDLYRWNKALYAGEVVGIETLEEIFRDHIEIAPGAGHYSYGWMTFDFGFDKMTYHGGNTLGFTAEIARLNNSNIDIIILSNKGYVDLNTVKNNIINILFGAEVELPQAKVVIEIEDTSIYDKYVGKYELLPEMGIDTLEILKVDEKLYAQVEGQGAAEIYPETETQFFATIANFEIEFIIDEDGNVNELIFKQYPSINVNSKKIAHEEQKEVFELDPEIRDRYIGEYELMPGANITIFIENEKFHAQVTGQQSMEIYPVSETEFSYRLADATIAFKFDQEGNVTGLVLEQAGMELPGTKIN